MEQAALEDACVRARDGGLLALDTEFVWMRTYRPQLGLVQLGCRRECWALDALSAVDPQPLANLVADAAVVKILHDARQDLTHIRHYAGACPRNVFDTQLAAAFAGFPSGIGLQKLLVETIGVSLPKTETLTDWTRRPLSADQVGYALDDVRYLAELREALLQRAEGLGTRAWLEEDMRRYDEPSLYDDLLPDMAWKRVKTGRQRLNGRGRAALRAVAAVREETAARWNLPRAWLGDDGSLVGMAVSGCVGRLVHRLRGPQLEAIRSAYESALRQASGVPEKECPADLRPHYIEEVRQAADAAMEWLGGRAEELHVAASVIASRAVVTAFVDDADDGANPLSAGWRQEAVGREMAERFAVA